jgi:hypothetical protein
MMVQVDGPSIFEVEIWELKYDLPRLHAAAKRGDKVALVGVYGLIDLARRMAHDDREHHPVCLTCSFSFGGYRRPAAVAAITAHGGAVALGSAAAICPICHDTHHRTMLIEAMVAVYEDQGFDDGLVRLVSVAEPGHA